MSFFLSDRMEIINREYFQFDTLPAIRWSKGKIKKRYRKLTFGTFDIKKKEIRIHPILKSNNIPSFVLDFVLYHELLHYQDQILRSGEKLQPKVQPVLQPGLFQFVHAKPVRNKNKKNKIHSIDFHKRERVFPLKKEATGIMRDIVNGSFNLETSD